MTKFIFFITMFFLYMALLQSYSPYEKQILDIKNQKGLIHAVYGHPQFNKKRPYSIILTDVYREGVFIKTSFISLKMISPFQAPSTLNFKVRSNYYHYLKPFIGYEIIRHRPDRLLPQNAFLPPGFSFVGNPILGYWNKKNRIKKWAFYRYYHDLYNQLAWNTPKNSYRPTVMEYRSLNKSPKIKNFYISDQSHSSLITRVPDNIRQTSQIDFILKNETKFGTNGTHTPFIAPEYFQRQRQKLTNLLTVASNYYHIFFQDLKTIKANK